MPLEGLMAIGEKTLSNSRLVEMLMAFHKMDRLNCLNHAIAGMHQPVANAVNFYVIITYVIFFE
jgi:hypothetical protein